MSEQPSNAGGRATEPTAGSNSLWGSDVIADALREQNIPYACLNPGASYRGLHDSMVNYLGNENPKMVVCLHEEHAVGIAHGWATVTGTPLIAIVHSNVGLMHATMGVFNAWCNRMPIVMLGATGPVDAAKRRPWIDWIHTSADQGALVRGYTKWDDQPGSPEAAVESIRRAFQIATARPQGPVYVNFDAAVQEMTVEASPKIEKNVKRFSPPSDVEPPRSAVADAVAALARAKNPVILSGRVSRSEEGWKQRVELAEWIGARVITSSKDSASFPTSHPLYAGEVPWRLRQNILELVQGADVILSIDWLDLGGTVNQAFPPGRSSGPTVISISNDHLIHGGWNMDYQILPAVDIWLPVVPETAVPALLEGLAKANVPKKPKKTRTPPKVAPPERTAGAPSVADVARLFASAVEGEKVSILSRSLGWPPNANTMEHPLDFLGSNGGGGVGGGPGMAVGAALALRDRHPGRIPVAILGDGDFMMGCNAFWTAANQDIPLLVIVTNNRSYYNDEEHQRHIAHHRHRPVENAPIGQRIEQPPPDLVGVARAQGWEGEGPVMELKDVPAALKRGLEAVKAGKRWVIDIVVDPEYVRRPLVEYL
ncbi:MAG: thiamine pyrophosphate-binding protein [Hyphomicrobiaceae bacterium]